MSGAEVNDGSGVLLRPARESDAERWLEMLQDPDCVAYGSPAHLPIPRELTELTERIEKSQSAWAERSPGVLVVADSHDPTVFLGDIGWRWTFSPLLGVVELGYAVHPQARGRGVGRRALVSLSDWLFGAGDLGVARVQLDHSVENVASCRLALAAGFEREGVRRAFLPLRDPASPGGVRRHDVCLHGKVATHVEQG